MCHTSILDVLKVLLHILEPDPSPSKRDIIKSIDDFRRMCSIFSQPGAGKKHDSNLRGDTISTNAPSNMESTT